MSYQEQGNLSHISLNIVRLLLFLLDLHANPTQVLFLWKMIELNKFMVVASQPFIFSYLPTEISHLCLGI